MDINVSHEPHEHEHVFLGLVIGWILFDIRFGLVSAATINLSKSIKVSSLLRLLPLLQFYIYKCEINEVKK